MVVGHRAEVDPLVHPQRIGGARDQRGRGDGTKPEIERHRAQDHHPLADEPTGAGQAAVGHREEQREGRKFGHGVDDATITGDVTRMDPVVQDADRQEHRARDEAMRDHLHQAARDTEFVEDEKPQGDKTHVGDRRVGHELLHVLLHQRHQTDVDHRDQAQRNDDPGVLMRGVGRDRHRKTQEAVSAEL